MRRFAVHPRIAVGLIVVGLAVVVVLGVRIFIRLSDYKVAIVTPKTNVHREFSNDLGPRIYRVLHYHQEGDDGKLIALTFDDGPYPIFTPLLLDELKRLRVHATFFLIGRDAQQWPTLAHRVVADGNEVGDHTYSHPSDFNLESAAQVREEILRGRNALWAITHDPSVRWLMRPPHGRFSELTLQVAQSLGYHVVLWTDDSGDFRNVTPQELIEHAKRNATRPEIILFHSGELATIEALPTLVALFRAEGYRFVTVTELLREAGTKAINHPIRRSL